MKDKWDFYFCQIDNIIASVALNLEIAKGAPLADKNKLIYVWIKMKEPREDGLSNSSEIEKLKEIEDCLDTALSKELDAIQVGRVTTNGRREFYYYANNCSDLEKVVNQVISKFPTYEYLLGSKDDIAWSQYFEFLYPTPKQFQWMNNRKLVDYLKEQGDPLTKIRPIHHWLYFPTTESRSKFKEEIKASGFSIEKEGIADDKFPYMIHISRSEPAEFESINDTTFNLIDIANQFGGDYDGWETKIIN